MRFVATKELCHALEEDATVRVKSFPALERLIKALQADHASEVGAVYPPFQSEITAEICALELLCPLRDRKRIIAKRAATGFSDMAIAKAFVIPVAFVQMLFDPAFVAFMEATFSEGN